jgi:hypothetical protein
MLSFGDSPRPRWAKLGGIWYGDSTLLFFSQVKVILFDLGSAMSRLSGWKHELWQATGISTPSDDRETNDAILLAYLVTWFLSEVRRCRDSLFLF